MHLKFLQRGANVDSGKSYLSPCEHQKLTLESLYKITKTRNLSKTEGWGPSFKALIKVRVYNNLSTRSPLENRISFIFSVFSYENELIHVELEFPYDSWVKITCTCASSTQVVVYKALSYRIYCLASLPFLSKFWARSLGWRCIVGNIFLSLY